MSFVISCLSRLKVITCTRLNVTLQAIMRQRSSQQIRWHCSMRLLCILNICLHNRNSLFPKSLQSACSQSDPLSRFYTNFTGKMLPLLFWQVACTASVPPGRCATFSRAPADRCNSYEQILLGDGCQLSSLSFFLDWACKSVYHFLQQQETTIQGLPESMLFSILSRRAATFSLGPALGSTTTASSSSWLVLYLQ